MFWQLVILMFQTPESEKVATQMLLSVVDYIGWRLIRGDFKGFQKLEKQDYYVPANVINVSPALSTRLYPLTMRPTCNQLILATITDHANIGDQLVPELDHCDLVNVSSSHIISIYRLLCHSKHFPPTYKPNT